MSLLTLGRTQTGWELATERHVVEPLLVLVRVLLELLKSTLLLWKTLLLWMTLLLWVTQLLWWYHLWWRHVLRHVVLE